VRIYIVQKGDSLFKIAQLHETTVEELMRFNPHIINPNDIDVGMKLKIPQDADRVESANGKKSKQQSPTNGARIADRPMQDRDGFTNDEDIRSTPRFPLTNVGSNRQYVRNNGRTTSERLEQHTMPDEWYNRDRPTQNVYVYQDDTNKQANDELTPLTNMNEQSSRVNPSRPTRQYIYDGESTDQKENYHEMTGDYIVGYHDAQGDAPSYCPHCRQQLSSRPLLQLPPQLPSQQADDRKATTIWK